MVVRIAFNLQSNILFICTEKLSTAANKWRNVEIHTHTHTCGQSFSQSIGQFGNQFLVHFMKRGIHTHRTLSACLRTVVASAPWISENFHRINYIRLIRFRYRSHSHARLLRAPPSSLSLFCPSVAARSDLNEFRCVGCAPFCEISMATWPWLLLVVQRHFIFHSSV